MIQAENTFHIGINDDTHIKLLQKGEYVDALNCRSTTIGGEIGEVTNIDCTVLVDYPELFPLPVSGNTYVIGQCDDKKNGYVYYFVYNSLKFNSIYRYNTNQKIVECIVYENQYLAFSDSFIKANIIGDILTWSSEDNPPQRINVTRAYNYTNGIAVNEIDTYIVIAQQELDAIACNPDYAPTYIYQTDASVNTNNIRGGLWQFAYIYQYKDKEKSVLSPISRCELPYGDENVDGTYVDQTINNKIQLTYNVGSTEVAKILLYARSNRLDQNGDSYTQIEANNSVWYLIDTVDVFNDDGTRKSSMNAYMNVNYDFYNNISSEVADQNDLLRPYDYVPIKATSQESFSDNTRILYNDYTEGYDNVAIDVDLSELTYKTEDVSPSTITASTPSQAFLSLNYLQNGEVIEEYNYDPTNPLSERCTVTVNEIKTTYIQYYFSLWTLDILPDTVFLLTLYDRNAIAYYFSYKSKDGDTYFEVINALILAVSQNAILWQTEPHTANYNISASLVLQPFTTNHYYLWISVRLANSPLTLRPTLTISPASGTFTSFKRGAMHEFGIVYSDKQGRRGAVNINGDSKLYIKALTESYPDVTMDAPFVSYVNWQINHVAPSWATHYQWVYTKNVSMLKYLQFTIESISSATGGVTGLVLNINTPILYLKKARSKSIISTYVFQPGDRVRFIANYVSNVVLTVDGFVDMEIIGVDENNNPIVEIFDYTSLGIGVESLIEIYTPAKELKNAIYYEFGQEFELEEINGVKYHKGSTQNQTEVQPAKGIFTRGDTYSKTRFTAFGSSNYNYVESESFSDYYFSSSYDIGRINVVEKEARQTRFKEKARHGGQIIIGTGINNIFQFAFNDETSFSNKFGGLINAIEVGDIIKFFQPNKLTSVFVNKKELSNADGSSNIVATDKVLASHRLSTSEYGCANIESMAVNNNYIYFIDVNRGVPCRDASNGVQDISYNLSGLFKDVCDEYLANTGISILGVYDKYNDEYIVQFNYIKDNVSTSKAFAFHEPSNRWKTRYDLLDAQLNHPDIFASVNQTMVSFISGNLWLHNQIDDNKKGQIYGQQKPLEIEFVINDNPNKIKTFNTLWLVSNTGNWSASITIEPCDMYPDGMTSRLKSTNFIGKEGRYYAAFMKDEQTLGVINPIFNGRDLRGDVIKIRLINNSNTEVKLFSVKVMYDLSELS